MKTTIDHLNAVLSHVLGNKLSMATAVKQTSEKLKDITPEVQDALDVLVKAYPENTARTVGEIIGAQEQLKVIGNTQREVDALIAATQFVLSNEDRIVEVEKQLIANKEIPVDHPLPLAAGASGLAAAAGTEDADVTAVPAEKAIIRDTKPTDREINRSLAEEALSDDVIDQQLADLGL